MDCVGCGKCQLWGKVQTTGLATAMKILFELDEKALEYVSITIYNYPSLTQHPSPHSNANLLQRSEVVALINTLHRFTESLAAVDTFRSMWSGISTTDSENLITETEKYEKHVMADKVYQFLFPFIFLSKLTKCISRNHRHQWDKPSPKTCWKMPNFGLHLFFVCASEGPGIASD
jgi:hypothetical protein